MIFFLTQSGRFRDVSVQSGFARKKTSREIVCTPNAIKVAAVDQSP